MADPKETPVQGDEVPEDAVDPQMPQSKAPVEPRQKRKISRFQEIYSQIQTAKDAVAFIENYQKDFVDTNTGTLQLFIQAFAGHSAKYYAEFFKDPLSKPHALFLLEQTSVNYGVQAKGSSYGSMAPFILEFVLRCEAGGMAAGKSWMQDVPGPMLGQESLPITPAKDMLAQLSSKDEKGKASRRVEIVTDKAELLAVCQHLTTDETYDHVGVGDVTNMFGKLFSKCRKIVTTQNKPKKGKGQKRNRDGEEGKGDDAEKDGDDAAPPAATEATDNKEPGSLTPCPKDVVQAMISVFEFAFVKKHVPPPPKFAVFVEWLRRGEVSESTETALQKVETAVAKLGDVEADQLELVMTLKTCGEDPKEFKKALAAVCNQEVEEDEDAAPSPPAKKDNMFTPLEEVNANAAEDKDDDVDAVIVLDETLKLTSPDVLSALAVAANKVKEGNEKAEEGNEGKEQTEPAEEKANDSKIVGLNHLSCKHRAIKLLEKVAAKGVTLPRRALTLVLEERAKERRKRQGPQAMKQGN